MATKSHRQALLTMSARTLYWIAGVAIAAELTAYLLWRRRVLRRRATSDETAA